MTTNSKIEWTDHTINFWWGCEKVSAGCKNCYAETFSKRVGNDIWGRHAARRWIKSAAAEAMKLNAQAKKLGVRYRVFSNSMSDFFEEDYGQPIKHLAKLDGKPFMAQVWFRHDIGPCTAGQTTVNHSRGERHCTLTDIRNYAFGIIDQCQNLDWILVTKRPENIRRLWPCYTTPPHKQYRPNVILLTSVENQEQADIRILELLKCSDLCPVQGLSVEPMLGTVCLQPRIVDGKFENHQGINVDWVICGGESGHHARPFNVQWARSLRDQCQAAGVPFFMKQLGSKPYFQIPPLLFGPTSTPVAINLQDSKGGDWDEWTASYDDLKVREFPKT